MALPPVIFVHGMWCPPQVWENYQPRFEKAGFKTFAPALRHHDVAAGDPPPDGLGTTSLTDYVDDIVALIDTMDAPPVLVGHSLGGLIVQLAAARAKVAGLVALTPAPPAGVFMTEITPLKVFRRILTTWGHWRKPTFATFEEIRFGTFNRISEEEARDIYSRALWDSGRVTAEISFWFFDPNKASYVDTSKITCPVLILGAAHDRIIPASAAKAAAKRYGGRADYVLLEDHAHWILGESGWEKIADRCIKWIKRAHISQ